MFQAFAEYPVLAGCALCLGAAGIFDMMQRWLLPLKIPAQEIEAMAQELIINFGFRAPEIAQDHQERAAWRSDPYEEGKWRRVERVIVARLTNGFSGPADA